MKCSKCGEEMKSKLSFFPTSWRCPRCSNSYDKNPNDGHCPQCAKDAACKAPIQVEETGGISRTWTCPKDHSVNDDSVTVAELIKVHVAASSELDRLTRGEVYFAGPADRIRAIMAELEARIRRERPDWTTGSE